MSNFPLSTFSFFHFFSSLGNFKQKLSRLIEEASDSCNQFRSAFNLDDASMIQSLRTRVLNAKRAPKNLKIKTMV